jgi:hypothetical protein
MSKQSIDRVLADMFTAMNARVNAGAADEPPEEIERAREWMRTMLDLISAADRHSKAMRLSGADRERLLHCVLLGLIAHTKGTIVEELPQVLH